MKSNRKFYTVDFCTGDNHGAFTGFVEAVEVWEHSEEGMEALIELTPHVWDEEARQWLGLPFGYNTNANSVVRSVTIAGETFPIIGGPNSGGNWSWDSVTMRLNQICRLLNHLKGSRHITGCHYATLPARLPGWLDCYGPGAGDATVIKIQLERSHDDSSR